MLPLASFGRLVLTWSRFDVGSFFRDGFDAGGVDFDFALVPTFAVLAVLVDLTVFDFVMAILVVLRQCWRGWKFRRGNIFGKG